MSREGGTHGIDAVDGQEAYRRHLALVPCKVAEIRTPPLDSAPPRSQCGCIMRSASHFGINAMSTPDSLDLNKAQLTVELR